MTGIAIADNITKLIDRIRIAAEINRRDATSVTLLAVSKTQPGSAIRSAAAAGITNLGENYLQEALEKMKALSDLPLCWHFIGPIQSNKTRSIAEHFDWVHSVDRLKIARRLSEQRPAEMPPLQICLQVNISGESTKSGVLPAELAQLTAAVNELPALRLRGLMTIPAVSSDTVVQRQAFARLRLCLEDLQATMPGLDTLSMGMSADLESAIAEGATIVRIGTGVFGPRGG
jgi:pyridoxal phosphate enzyme (YggS family)